MIAQDKYRFLLSYKEIKHIRLNVTLLFGSSIVFLVFLATLLGAAFNFHFLSFGSFHSLQIFTFEGFLHIGLALVSSAFLKAM